VTFYEGSRYRYFGPLCLNVYTLAGWWASLGVHLSLRPCYVDLHLLWWVVSLMSRKRGEWLHEVEEESVQ
jgi:hypothetical protein